MPYANFGNPQSLNLYTYGENNPTTFGDPDGHFVGAQDDQNKQQPPQQQQQSESHTMWYYMFNTNTSGTDHNSSRVTCDSSCYQSWMAFSETTSLIGGTYAATTAVTTTASASAQDALDSAVANRTSNPAVMVGAYDQTTGATAVGSSGSISRLGTINPDFAAAAEAVGGVGALNPGASSPVGCCAEFEAFNKLMNEGSSMDNIKLTDAVRPRNGDVIPKCETCQQMFPDK